jgi:hypothetical protein
MGDMNIPLLVGKPKGIHKLGDMAQTKEYGN